jgi:membrane protease YdiL (CAAX protease family)
MSAVDPNPAPRARARVRWGLPDVALAWFAGLLASLFLALPFYDSDRPAGDQPVRYLVAAVLLQNLGIVLALIFVSKRKGQDSLGRDFGLVWPFDRLESGAVVGWIAAGAGLSIVGSMILRPIIEIAGLDEPAQQVSQTVEDATGAGLALLVISVVLVAPAVEELLFRGALLRALQRRFSAPMAVFVSAAIFAGIHVLGDPDSGYVIPALLLLGLVSGYQAVKRGDLSRCVLLHMGFNLLSTIALVLS